ncbi:MAG: ATP-binding cassette domain-containing protein, partial [Chloroflexota bacterium]
MTATKLHLKNVTKSFGGGQAGGLSGLIFGKSGPGRVVVDIEELTLGSYGIEGLIGPNGAGKTTLMSLITGKLAMDQGEILYAPQGATIDISHKRLDQIARLGLVRTNQIIQDFDSLSIKDSLLLSLSSARYEKFYKLFNESALEKEAAEEIDAYLDYFQFENPKGHALSAGEKKLLDIIRCLLLKPKFLLMDEPTAGLPEDQTRQVMDLMTKKSIEEKMSILIVEHDLDLIWE